MDNSAALTEYLGGFMRDERRKTIAAVLAERTRHLTVVLEDIYQPHNASACLRSCECLGVQDVHIIEKEHTYSPNHGVALGSSKWLSRNRYESSSACFDSLKKQGYQLVATLPHEDGHDLLTLPLDRPVAILFGTEEVGLSDEALAAADTTLRLPSYGFTQSYNISVTVAMTLARLVERLRESEIDWRLSEEEIAELTLEFYRRTVKRPDLLEKEFLEKQ